MIFGVARSVTIHYNDDNANINNSWIRCFGETENSTILKDKRYRGT